MASRPELLQIADELEITDIIENMTIEEMTEEIRNVIDKKFNRKFHVSPKGLSETLLKFMTEEYDYYLVDKKGKKHNYKGDPI